MSHFFDPVAPLDGNTPPEAPYEGTYPGDLPLIAQVSPSGGDDAASINALFSAGAMVVDGGGKTFSLSTSVEVPEDARLRNIVIQLETPGMSGVLVNHRSKVQAHIIGTGTIGSSGNDFYERGIYPAVDGASDVELDVTVENMTLGVNPRPLATLVPKRWTGIIRAKNIVGFTGNSEGYALLASPASDCCLTLISDETKRHALYLSNGASGNKIDVIANGGDHAPVQLYSTSAQPACENNVVTAILSDVNAGIGADATWGVNLFGKVEGNHIDVTIRDSSCEGAVLLRSADDAAICRGNTVIARAYGSFSGDIVRADASVENTIEVYGKGTTSNAGRNIVGARPYSSITVPATAKHCIHLKRLVWDAEGTDLIPVLSSVTALRTDIGRGIISMYNSSAVTNLSDFTSGRIDGYVYADSLTVATASIAAGAEGNAVFTFARGTYVTSRVFSVGATMVGVTGAADAPNITVTSLSSTGATVRIKNNTASAAVVTVRFRIEGW